MDDYATRRENARLAAQPYVDKLAAFQTAQEIRDFLVDEEIKAHPVQARACAIAMYVSRGSGEQVSVARSLGVCLAGFVEDRVGKLTEVGACTPAMREFIANFDNGRYPELMAEEVFASAG